jgi:hypothetical protein
MTVPRTLLAALLSAVVALLCAGSARAGVVFNGSFYGQALAPPWSSLQAPPGRASVVPAPGGINRRAYRAELQGGDPLVSEGQRNELLWGSDPHPTLTEGTDYYFGWMTYFPRGFPSPGTPSSTSPYGHCTFVQWKNTGRGGAPVDMSCRLNRIQIGYDPKCGGWSIPLIRGGWNKFVAHLVFSTSATTGLLELWHQSPNQSALTKKLTCNLPTLDPNGTSYLKLGYYRKNDEQKTGVIFDVGMRVGTSFGSVAP